MFYLLHKHQWNTKPFPLIIFWCEKLVKGAIYYVAIATVIFLDVNFDMWRYQVFARKFSRYFIGVYIIRVVSSVYWLILTSSLPREKPHALIVSDGLGQDLRSKNKQEWEMGGGLRDILTFFSFLWLKISVGYFLIIKCWPLNNNALFLLR